MAIPTQKFAGNLRSFSGLILRPLTWPLPLSANEVANFQQQPAEEQALALAWYRLQGVPNPEDRVTVHTTFKKSLRPQLGALEGDS